MIRLLSALKHENATYISPYMRVGITLDHARARGLSRATSTYAREFQNLGAVTAWIVI